MIFEIIKNIYYLDFFSIVCIYFCHCKKVSIWVNIRLFAITIRE